MVHFPVGVQGWVIFFTGLLIVAYRIHGIDAPRSWIEAVERQFADTRKLQLIGVLLMIATLAFVYLSSTISGLLGWLYVLSCTLLFVVGTSLVVATNHVRHTVMATAEAEDKTIRLVSSITVVLGLLWALVPWFL